MKCTLISIIGIVVCLSGCEAYQEIDTPVIRSTENEYEYMLVFALDTSPSFKEQMLGQDAAACNFFTATLEKYIQDRGNLDDRVLITGLCDKESPLLWQGKPRDLLRELNTPEALKQFLAQHSKAKKNVYGSLAATLDYVSDLPPVQSRKAKACVIVISNMMDDSRKHKEDQAKMSVALKQLSTVRSEIGFWWIDQRAIKDCKKCFRNVGLPEPQWAWGGKPEPLSFENTN